MKNYNYQKQTMNQYLKKFIKKNYKEPGKALDLGCGDKKDMIGLEKIGWRVAGVDLPNVNLEKEYISTELFDFVYSNYVLMFIKNKKSFISTIHKNLKPECWTFLHVINREDEEFKELGMDIDELTNLFKNNFFNHKYRTLKIWDDEPGHKHWHNVIEFTAQNTRR